MLHKEPGGGNGIRPDKKKLPEKEARQEGPKHAKKTGDGDPPVVGLDPFRYLRVVITKPAMGWGVSLWQIDLIGGEEVAS
jgi:hypothetical protein